MHHFRSADSFWYRAALYLAFAALFLLFAGPLLSQFQAHFQTQWQAQSQAPHPTSEHSSHGAHAHGGMAHDESLATPSHAHHHWYHPCDYCAIWQHTPTAPQHLPAIGSMAFISRTPLPTVFAPRAAVWHNYPHALPRAPPLFRIV
ncbi:DUF2946 family protein [Vreelandella sp.]|uniref:DUF2946 family protein n=1 Tax=Vreelandella sp. TaxID=3137778 RepID=UPI003BAB780F